MELLQTRNDFIITDIYHGFRHELHFTIAAKRLIDGGIVVSRSTLDPGKMYEYISSLQGPKEAFTSIVNKEGLYQVVTEHLATPLETSFFVPRVEPPLGVRCLRLRFQPSHGGGHGDFERRALAECQGGL